MKKSLLALAVLSAIAGVAQAQSSVTLYGKVDLGAVYDSGNPNGKSVRISSGVTGGSRLGFKGVEDLGGGYKASFQLETGYCANGTSGVEAVTSASGATGLTNPKGFCTGSNSFMGRQAYGALSGAFGTASAGRQYTFGFNNLATIDPFGAGYAGQANNLVDPNGIRINNSFQYVTPTFSGLSAGAEVALGETTGNWAANRETGGEVVYASGPIYLGATYYGVDEESGSGTAKKDFLIGGTYDFGIAKIHAGYQHTSGNDGAVSSESVIAGGPLAFNDFLIGTTVPLGGGSLLASFVDHKDKNDVYSASQIGIGYNYPLSKRTAIYTAFAKINYQQQSSVAEYTVGNATDSGTGNKAFNLGVVHNF